MMYTIHVCCLRTSAFSMQHCTKIKSVRKVEIRPSPKIFPSKISCYTVYGHWVCEPRLCEQRLYTPPGMWRHFAFACTVGIGYSVGVWKTTFYSYFRYFLHTINQVWHITCMCAGAGRSSYMQRSTSVHVAGHSPIGLPCGYAKWVTWPQQLNLQHYDATRVRSERNWTDVNTTGDTLCTNLACFATQSPFLGPIYSTMG